MGLRQDVLNYFDFFFGGGGLGAYIKFLFFTITSQPEVQDVQASLAALHIHTRSSHQAMLLENYRHFFLRFNNNYLHRIQYVKKKNVSMFLNLGIFTTSTLFKKGSYKKKSV